MIDPARQRNDLKLSDHIQVSGDGALDYGSLARKTAKRYANHRAAAQTNMWDFRGETNADEDSGVCTPPLWRSSPPESPQLHHGGSNHYRSLSPASRTQAIAQGQMELMEMVRNMPESCYELSLKDLVELPRARQELGTMGVIQSDGRAKRQNSNRRVEGSNNKGHMMVRSGSIDNGGFLLKMMFPIPWGSSKKRDNSGNNFSKVSPRPSMDGPVRVGVEEEWWKKRNYVPGDGESVDSSVNARSMKSSGRSSSSSSSRCNRLSSSKRRGDGGCCSFLWTKKSELPK